MPDIDIQEIKKEADTNEATTSESLRKAIAKYNKEKTVAYTIRFNKNTEADLIDYIDGLENKTGTIKKLLRESMEGEKKQLRLLLFFLPFEKEEEVYVLLEEPSLSFFFLKKKQNIKEW